MEAKTIKAGDERWLLEQGEHIMIMGPDLQKSVYFDVPITVWPDERYGEEQVVEVLRFN